MLIKDCAILQFPLSKIHVHEDVMCLPFEGAYLSKKTPSKFLFQQVEDEIDTIPIVKFSPCLGGLLTLGIESSLGLG